MLCCSRLVNYQKKKSVIHVVTLVYNITDRYYVLGFIFLICYLRSRVHTGLSKTIVVKDKSSFLTETYRMFIVNYLTCYCLIADNLEQFDNSKNMYI